MFAKIIKFIIDTLSNGYDNFLKILYILDSDIRRDVFIGVTGLMVAIIIFIAEVISNKQYELEKRLILKKTEITKNMKFCVFIYLIIFILSIFSCSFDDTNDLGYIYCDILYIIFQLLINISIFVFMYKTVSIFIIAVKLNTDKEYFNKELDNYIYKRTVEIEKEACSKSLKNIKNLKRDFEKYINNNKQLSNILIDVGFSEECYIPIYSNRRGMIKSYNYKKIDSIIENINNLSNDESKEYLSSKEPIYVFAKQIGDKIDKYSIIGYCLKGYQNYFKDFSNYIIYDENSMYIGDEIKLINENLFEMANEYNEPDDFDDNNKLFNYFNHLYKNDLNGIRNLAIFQLEEITRKVYKDKYKNNRYAVFLNKISSLAYNNDNYDEYKNISRLIYFLYYQQLQQDGCDIRQVAYNFSNNYFKYDYFSIKKSSDIRFYDELMSNLLRFICDLIREKKFEAVPIVFKNTLLAHERYVYDDLDEKGVLNLQFASGIICCLIMFTEKNQVTEDEKEIIKNVIKWTKSHFINIYDGWKIIISFKKYFNKTSSIQNVYDQLEFNFIDHKYLSSWSGWHIDEKLILKELICAFNVRLFSIDDIDYNEITKEDKYYFSNLLDMFNSENRTKFEELLKLKLPDERFNVALKKVVDDAERKEKEYIKNNKLNKSKVKEFETIVKNEVFKNSKLEEYLIKLNKVEMVDITLKRFCGINQLLPREIFFENYGGHETLAEQFGGIFVESKDKEFIKKIDSFSKKTEDDINEVISKLKNVEEYLLITDYINCSVIKNYDYNSENIIVNDMKLDILTIPESDCIYLIQKKYLPKLQYCNFDQDLPTKNIDKNLFYELKDCSTDEDLRNKIIENSSWLSEKGNIDEQHEFLKQQCRLRLYLAYRFYKVKNSESLKFIINKYQD